MDRDPVLYHILETDYNGEVRGSTVHLFDNNGEICWSRYSDSHHYPNPHDELAEQLVIGNEAMGRYYRGELTEKVSYE